MSTAAVVTRTRVRTARLVPGMTVTAITSPYEVEGYAMRPTTRYGPGIERRTVSSVSATATAALRIVEFTDGTRSILVPGHQAWTVESPDPGKSEAVSA